MQMENAQSKSDCLTLREVAAQLKTSVEHVRALCVKWESGGDGLPCENIGGGHQKHRRVRAEDLAAFREKRRQRPGDAGRAAIQRMHARRKLLSRSVPCYD